MQFKVDYAKPQGNVMSKKCSYRFQARNKYMQLLVDVQERKRPVRAKDKPMHQLFFLANFQVKVKYKQINTT